MDAGNSSSADDNVCLTMTGNVSADSNAAAGLGIRKQGTVATTNDFGIHNLSPSPTTGTTAAAFLAGLNTGGVDAINGDNFVASTWSLPAEASPAARNSASRPSTC